MEARYGDKGMKESFCSETGPFCDHCISSSKLLITSGKPYLNVGPSPKGLHDNQILWLRKGYQVGKHE